MANSLTAYWQNTPDHDGKIRMQNLPVFAGEDRLFTLQPNSAADDITGKQLALSVSTDVDSAPVLHKSPSDWTLNDTTNAATVTIARSDWAAFPSGRYRWIVRDQSTSDNHVVAQGWFLLTADPDAAGQVPSAVPIYFAPTGPAGGALAGTYPNPSLADPDLVAIAALPGTPGNLIKTGPNTWAIDTTLYQPIDGNLTEWAAITPGACGDLVGTSFLLTSTGYGIESTGRVKANGVWLDSHIVGNGKALNCSSGGDVWLNYGGDPNNFTGSPPTNVAKVNAGPVVEYLVGIKVGTVEIDMAGNIGGVASISFGGGHEFTGDTITVGSVEIDSTLVIYNGTSFHSITSLSTGVRTATLQDASGNIPVIAGNLAVASAKTLTASNTLTLTGTDGSSVAFGGGGTVLYSGGALGTPSSGTLTNCSGTAASLTAGNATKLATARTLAITGDLTWTSPSFDGSASVTAAGTLATVNSNVGTFGDATHYASLTVNAKGLVTAASQTAWPTFNQNTTGSAATLTTPRAIYGNNFDGSAALTQIIASTYGGTGNGFTKFSGPTTSEKTKTLRDATDTILELGGSYTPTGTWTSMTLVTPALGTPASGVLTNCTGYPGTSALTTTGTLTSGATGSGFTIALSTSTITGTLPLANGGQTIYALASAFSASGASAATLAVVTDGTTAWSVALAAATKYRIRITFNYTCVSAVGYKIGFTATNSLTATSWRCRVLDWDDLLPLAGLPATSTTLNNVFSAGKDNSQANGNTTVEATIITNAAGTLNFNFASQSNSNTATMTACSTFEIAKCSN